MLVLVLPEANVKRRLNMEEILLEETLIKGKGKINRSGKGESSDRSDSWKEREERGFPPVRAPRPSFPRPPILGLGF